MTVRYSEVNQWNKFKSSCPGLSRDAIKFQVAGGMISVYLPNRIAIYDSGTRRTMGFASKSNEIPDFNSEEEFRVYLAGSLRTACICRGIRQTDLAKSIGVPREQLNRYFNGIHPIPSYILYKMLQTLGILFSDLMSE